MSRRRKLLVLPLVTATLALAFYGTMNWAARFETDRSGTSPSARNSIQHAFAAAETYAALRIVYVPDAWAVSLAVNLGLLNEHAEAWFKWPRDTTREVYKDLHNNMIGIIAAQTAMHCARTPNARLRLIGQLAANQTLIWKSGDARVPDLPQPLQLQLATARFTADRPEIERTAREVTARLLAPGCER
jgi:hypothetical protein